MSSKAGGASMLGMVTSHALGDPAPETRRPSIIPGPEAAESFELDAAAREKLGIFGYNSRDIRSRPFNLLRTQLLKLREARGWRLFAITSPTPGAGKSFIATNLAAALSRSPGLDVYLFDLDLRKSSLAKNFGLEPAKGLESFLDGEVDTLVPIARRVAGERLVLVPCYPKLSHSAELLSGKPMELLAKAMRQLPSNAICICDLPPVFANDDAAIVSAQLDAFVMVVEEGRTTKKQVRDAANLLMPTPCAGSVLNRYEKGLVSDDYGYGYGRDKGYADYYG